MEEARNVGTIYECPYCGSEINHYDESEILTCLQCAEKSEMEGE